MMLRAKRGLMSRKSPWSTIDRISLYMSYGLRFESGTRSRSDSSRRSMESVQGTSGGGSSQLEPKYERYFLVAARHAASFSNSPSPTPLTSAWILEPPSSCSLISCPVTAFTSAGPPRASEPMFFTMGT